MKGRAESGSDSKQLRLKRSLGRLGVSANSAAGARLISLAPVTFSVISLLRDTATLAWLTYVIKMCFDLL